VVCRADARLDGRVGSREASARRRVIPPFPGRPKRVVHIPSAMVSLFINGLCTIQMVANIED
jgi:hypothetical protein